MRKVEDILNEILNKRGIITAEEREEYLSPKPELTYDPFLLDGMKAGVDLLISAARSGDRICIYGDYDADGVTASTIMACGVSQLTDDWFFYIPSRFEEGYGLNVTAIDKIIDRGANLIITVDCGCVSASEVQYALSKGLKVIVTDHHNIEDSVSEGIVIDPKKPAAFMLEEGKEPYPCQDLAGCGVAFKFIQALQRTADLPRSILTDALDMVAVGTIGDIVPLRDENRTLVKYGIAAANSGRRQSLAKLAEAISIEEITSTNIAFAIVPHINASGRMASAMSAVELFNSNDEKTIHDKVQELIHYNRQRKRIQEEAFEKCAEMVSGDENFIVLKVDNMHEGIAGIVAGKIKDQFQRPVIIVTPSEEAGRGGEGVSLLKGTGRSVDGVNIYEVLNKHSELFIRFGGHSKACGFLMEAGNFDRLAEGVNVDVGDLLREDPSLFHKIAETDAEITPEDVTVELARELLKMAPFGEGNPEPLLIMRNVDIRNVSYMGADSTHARFSACTPQTGESLGRYANAACVLFRRAQSMKPLLEGGERVDITGTVSHQVWRGQERVQFIVEDIMRV
ncbi:MAG: single-stranded-DNA-specific exonuclease RecJ [Clostridiales bacterium]|nr:single-stranded-DNA-specific exonuclease RecJ [Clostridiales bacterium]